MKQYDICRRDKKGLACEYMTQLEHKKILIVEDDEHIVNLIKYNLEKAHFSCTISMTGESALHILENNYFDLIILDLMLPEIDGLSVCKYIKKHEKLSDIPIMMVTAKREEVDRILGFELGIDDYVVKPFSPRELMLRVKAILKRTGSREMPKKVMRFADIEIDVTQHKVTQNQSEIKLTAMEFKLLVIFVERKGRVQSRERLLSDVWKAHPDMQTRTVDVHIKRLRKKLGATGKLLETVHGFGYRLQAKGHGED